MSVSILPAAGLSADPAVSESLGSTLIDAGDLLRGVVSLIDSYAGRDSSDEILAARSLARLAIAKVEKAQDLADFD